MKTKQSLLPIGQFFKQPSVSTITKHKKIEAKHHIPKKPRVDRKKQERPAREESLMKGAEGWKHFLQESGVMNVKRFNHEILFMVHGDAPRTHSEAAQQFTWSDFNIGSDEEIEE